MNNWITIISFTYPHEAHVAKGNLESEGIQVIIKDELTAQVNNYYSNAIGGVKLLINESDFEIAKKILIDGGYINENETVPSKFLTKIDAITAKFPLIGKSIIEVKLLVLVTFLLFIIIVPITLLSLPSNEEKLTKNYWCIDQFYYQDKAFTPQTTGNRLIFSDCPETMSFEKNGIVNFPGINSPSIYGNWELENNKLIIRIWSSEENPKFDNNLKIIDNEIKHSSSIYDGNYSIEITNQRIIMESENLKITGIAQ